MSFSANSPPPQGGSQTANSPTSSSQAPVDNRHRYFQYPKEERETLLRSLATDTITRNALETVLNSAPWTNQTGELDRFHLQALLELRRDNASVETFHCRFEDCTYENGESTNAVEHIRGTHFGNRPFLCDRCERAFTRKHDLRSHEKTHTREEEFDCEYCDATFTRSTNLNRHIKAAHPGRPTTGNQSP